MPLQNHLTQIFREFLNQATTKYRIGSSSEYDTAKVISKKKFCFNPYFSNECDVQVKLGGIAEHYFLINNLTYTVNAEQKVYNGAGRSSRCDLSIHEVLPNSLRTSHDSVMTSLKAVIEIKYANAVQPNYEFGNDRISSDLVKMSGIGNNILKYFILIDEADRIELKYIKSLEADCISKSIALITNNSFSTQCTNNKNISSTANSIL